MSELIDLSLLKESRVVLQQLLERRGLAYFLARDGRPLFSLEAEKVDLVVRSCLAKLSRRGRTVHPRAVEQCRRLVRRELIKRITEAMMQVGY
jgi:hypothetical protein